MPNWLADIQLIGGWLTPVVIVIGAVLLVVAVVVHPARRWLLFSLAGAILGAGLGYLLCWLLGDLLGLFEVTLSPGDRAWAAIAFAGAGVGTVALVRGHARRRVVGSALVVVALVIGGLGINADFGQYTTIGSVAGVQIAKPLPKSILKLQKEGAPNSTSAAATPVPVPVPTGAPGSADPLWQLPTIKHLPAAGVVHEVVIPSTVSGFTARPAYIYLPPAALVSNPVPLPVLILMSGQPGSPQNVITAGQIQTVFDDYAKAHNGLAPIVVVPDQLGAATANPMCVDSKLGNAQTYVTVDVVNWIKANLTVQTSAAAWAVGGYSEGGTCSIQFGAAFPNIFSGIVDILGQLGPSEGTVQHTINTAFGGNKAKYEAAMPAAIMAKHGRYTNTFAVFGSGQLDLRFAPFANYMYAKATAAGMNTLRIVSPGTSHDWATVRYVLENSLAPLGAHLGLQASAQ